MLPILRTYSRPLTALALIVACLAAGMFSTGQGYAITGGPVTYIVDNTLDTPVPGGCSDATAGNCSLREAITEANAHAVLNNAPNLIHFVIGGNPPWVISPTTALPAITRSVTIDASRQPVGGSPCVTTAHPTPCVTLMGPGSTGTQDGLVLNNGVQNVTIRGLSIVGYKSGIWVANASNVKIAGNFMGTADGTSPPANATANQNGVYVGAPSTGVTIGGTSAADRNIISGNGTGIYIDGTANTVEGNYIGTTAAGDGDLFNLDDGINLIGSNNIIGGTQPGAGNLISDNDFYGLDIFGGGGEQVLGNLIGTDVTGLKKLGGSGIRIYSSTGDIIGGTTAAARNVISGNAEDGVFIISGSGIQLMGNYIGTDATGNTALGNVRNGVSVNNGGSGVKIGGTDPGAGNVIQSNGGDGVKIDGGGAAGNAITANSIDDNGGLGIELANGANDTQPAPVLATAVSSSGSTQITGTVNTMPGGGNYKVEFFASPACDSSGFGEGRSYLGATTVTESSAAAPIDFTVPNDYTGQSITATATDSVGNTSQFSNCVKATAAPTPTPSPTPAPTATPTATPTPTASATHTPTPTPTHAAAKKGDGDCDGDVDANDAIDALEVYAGVGATPGCADQLDVNCDGVVDPEDALSIVLFAAGTPRVQPSGCGPIGA